jgi:hypothetical protein
MKLHVKIVWHWYWVPRLTRSDYSADHGRIVGGMCRTFIHGPIFHPASSLFPLPCPDEVGTAVGRDTGGATLGPRNLHQGVEVHWKDGVSQLGEVGRWFKGLYYENIIGLKVVLIFRFWIVYGASNKKILKSFFLRDGMIWFLVFCLGVIRVQFCYSQYIYRIVVVWYEFNIS